MLRWLGLALLVPAGSAQAAPVEQGALPLASRFDLTRFLVQAPGTERLAALDGDARWLPPDLGSPPGPPHRQPALRVRGKKVKFRMKF